MYTKEHKRTEISATCCSRRSSAPWAWTFLTFLAATVLVIPVFKSVKASPVLGFLFSGFGAGPAWVSFPHLDVHVISHCNFLMNSVYPGSM